MTRWFFKTAPALLVAAIAFSAPAAQAQDGLVLQTKACTTLNCQSLLIPARVNGLNGSSNPWVMTVLARRPTSGTACIRLEVTGETANLEMTAVTPSGTVFTGDNVNSGSCPQCPRVVIPHASFLDGYHTVVVNSASGAAVESGFTLRAAIYTPSSNPNCNNPSIGADDMSPARRAKLSASDIGAK